MVENYDVRSNGTDNKTRRERLEEHPDVIKVYEDRDHDWRTIEFKPNDPNLPDSYPHIDLRGKQPVVGRYCERFVYEHFPVRDEHTDWYDGIDMLPVQHIEVKGTRVVKKCGDNARSGRFRIWQSAHEKLTDNDGCYVLVVYQCDPTEDGEGMLFSVLDYERLNPGDVVRMADEAGNGDFKWISDSNKQGNGRNAQIRWDWVIDRDVERVFVD